MKIENVLSQNEMESSEDLEYVEAKLEKMQERFGSINKYLQTMMKKLDQLIKLQDDNLRKMSPDVYPDPETNLNPNSDPIPNPNPDLYLNSNPNPDSYPNPSPYPNPKLNPKSDTDLNPELDPNFESGLTRDEEAINCVYSSDEGEDERKEKKQENRREITGESDEDRSDQYLGRRPPLMPPLMPISPPSLQSPLLTSLPLPPRSSSQPTLWSKLLLHLSSCPSTKATQAVNKVCNVGSGNLFRIERALKPSKPNLVILCRPNLNPNPELVWTKPLKISIWPKPVFCVFSDINKGLLKIIRAFISSNPTSSMEKGEEWLAEGHWKLPPPWPPPLLPFSLPPPLPPPIVDVKLLNQNFHFDLTLVASTETTSVHPIAKLLLEYSCHVQLFEDPSVINNSKMKAMEINYGNMSMECLRKWVKVNKNDKSMKDLVLFLFETDMMTFGFSLEELNALGVSIHKLLKVDMSSKWGKGGSGKGPKAVALSEGGADDLVELLHKLVLVGDMGVSWSNSLTLLAMKRGQLDDVHQEPLPPPPLIVDTMSWNRNFYFFPP